MTRRATLALVAVGAALFLALLWMIGTGWGDDSNDGGSHAGGKGLNGFAGLVRLAAADGWDAALARDDAALDRHGLLVLTPAADTPGKDIARIVRRHRRVGPVMVIAPKWQTELLPWRTPGAKRGWVALAGARGPDWPGFLDRVNVGLLHGAKGAALRWRGAQLSGRLPDSGAIQAGSGDDDDGQPLVPVVWVAGGASAAPGPVLAADVAAARFPARPTADYPLRLVFEPDLLDNYGLSDPANAVLADRLLAGLTGNGPRAITFDVTLNGLGHNANLLTLAFTPPYLAATLCLILAAAAAGWRSFCRFGTPLAASRELPFGKAALVANGGALILRARRLHLLGPPYVAACRDRIARALALPRHTDRASTDAAIDRALAARSAAPGFAETAQSLHQARGAADIVAAAAALHDMERLLTR